LSIFNFLDVDDKQMQVKIENLYIGEMKIFIDNPNVKLMEEYKRHCCQRIVDVNSSHFLQLKQSLKKNSLESNVYSKISMGLNLGKFFL